MLSRLLRFGGLRVDDIMVPRADIMALEESEPLSELLRVFGEAGVSRIPLFSETLDDPRGMIHIKDLFRWLLKEAAGEIFNAPIASSHRRQRRATRGSEDERRRAISTSAASIFRGPSARPRSAGRCFTCRPRCRPPTCSSACSRPASTWRWSSTSTAAPTVSSPSRIWSSRSSATSRTSTTSPRPRTSPSIPKLGLVASARTPIKELEEHLGLKLLKPEEEEDIDTLGGLMFALLGRVPVRGELVRHPSGLELEVLDADARRLKKVRIHQPRAPGRGVRRLREGVRRAVASSRGAWAAVASNAGRSVDGARRLCSMDLALSTAGGGLARRSPPAVFPSSPWRRSFSGRCCFSRCRCSCG